MQWIAIVQVIHYRDRSILRYLCYSLTADHNTDVEHSTAIISNSFFSNRNQRPVIFFGVVGLCLVRVVLDLELLLHLPVVEHAEDVLAGAVDGAAEQEVGKAEVVVLASQKVVTILKFNQLQKHLL